MKLTEEEAVKIAAKYKSSERISTVAIQETLKLVAQKKFKEAKQLFLKSCPFPAISGRLAKENQDILAIERFLGSLDSPEPKLKKKTGKKIAIVGGGPTGMTAAFYLAKQGHDVHLYEAMDKLGGFLRYKVPEFRLPKEILDQEEERLKHLIKIHYNIVVGTGYPLEQVVKSYDAVGIATGANKPCSPCLPGEYLSEVFLASEFLYEPPAPGKQETLVIGGGNSAVDCARIAQRLGNNVTVIYRRDFKDFLADADSIQQAQDEGVKFLLLTQPVEILGEEKVTGLRCEQMMVSYTDDDGRNVTAPIEESAFEMTCDRIILAVGHEANPTLSKLSSIRTIGKGRPWVNAYRQTSLQKVFAAGMLLNPKLKFEGNLYEGYELANVIDLFVKGKLGEKNGELE